MPQLFSGLGDPLARFPLTGGRHLSLETGILRFQTESRPNVLLHHPSSVVALETLYLIEAMSKSAARELSEGGTDP